ncbi:MULTISPECIES: anti-sigma factor [Chryseobacterium]|uniref:Anti-sigma-K factor RskA n=1 Tax=Chryseobacterium camelliae TaxID=1265445 RepID=A0ABU0TGQ2_9FLAO|nr:MULTISPECIES: anti-sigma factor [Chryseobacterium]MDT3405968.1 anti-sigma-K factor RskA [Pseudacidovorax intermedius]MDQ1096229.1 anti-sigma-K factor RskA [Chryseobacterium camelliae]MDQ1100166.1 anti-sigma-K factor RskA [Chryseobacterium sp. SORGH_AS_1048]MDR6087509.1 anti-sigma-K factor RskA [Chryseobacterium sp. SORGH_AS_0909]MDR6131883.1 anti-sigma-K factor RskA [Chryseobacterium sp. SORGH_AS_1175]
MNTKEYISSGIIESYILGLASPDEASILECVMKNNAEVKAAFEEAQKILEDLATAQAVAPPADLKSKIWNKIQQEQITELPATAVSEEQPEHHIKPVNDTFTAAPEKKSGWKTYAVAATALFLVSTAANIFWMNERAESKKQIAQLESQQKNNAIALQNMQQKWNMISSPEMKMVMLKGVEKHTESKAMVFWDTKTKEVYLSADTLPKAPEGMQYQLWAIEGGKPVSAGMYSEDKDAKIALSTIPQAQAFAITLEKKGGSEVPTMENMYVMGEVSS